MNIDDIKAFCEAWSKVELTDGQDIELKSAWLDFNHAGRYSLQFRNQGFATSDFGKMSYSEDDNKRACPFWTYVTSPDVNYYDAEFTSKSRMAYAVALYAETFSKFEKFTDISDELGRLFDLVTNHDYEALAKWNQRRTGILFDKTGKITVDGSFYGIMPDVYLIPADI